MCINEVKCWNPLIKSTTEGRGSGKWWQCGVGGRAISTDLETRETKRSHGVQGVWPSGGLTARSLDWKGMGQDRCRLEVDGGAVLRREVGQESHNAAGTRGDFGWYCAAHQADPPRVRIAKEAVGTNTDRTVYGAASGAPPPLCRPPPRSRSPWRRARRRQHQQAEAQVAYHLGQLPTPERANWVSRTSKRQTASYPLGHSGGCPCRLVP